MCCALISAAAARCLAADPLPRDGAAPAVRGPAAVLRAIELDVNDTSGEIPATNRDNDGKVAVRGLTVIANAALLPAEAAPAAKEAPSLLEAIGNALANDPGGKRRLAAIAAAEELQIRQAEAQWRPQFEQNLYIELALLRRACKPDAKLFAEVAKAAKAGLHVPLRQYVRAVDFQGYQAEANDPRSAVQKLLVPLAERKLGPEKARLYRKECDQLAESRKHAAIMNMVVALDQRLVLTAAQRAKLVEVLSAKYTPFREAPLDYNSLLVDQVVVPLLNEKQKQVWQETPRQNDEENDAADVMIDAPDLGEAAETQEIARMVQEVKDGR